MFVHLLSVPAPNTFKGKMLCLVLPLLILLSAGLREGLAQTARGDPRTGASQGRRASDDGPGRRSRSVPRGIRRPRDPASPIRFFAAASTTDVVEEIVRQFEALTDYRVDLNIQSSGALAQQITTGGEADLFFSASQEWADEVTEPNLRGTSRVSRRVSLLTNRMVVIVPADSSLKVTSLASLLDPSVERLAIANPISAPAGRYAKEALEDAGLWERLRDKLIEGQDVRATLIHVQEGGAQAGIVYQTEAAVTDKVKVAWTIDQSRHSPIRYPLLLLRRGEGHPGARLLFEFFTAAVVYKKYGFDIAAAELSGDAAGGTDATAGRSRVGLFSSAEWDAVKLSCLVGIGVVAVSLPMAVFLGYVLARFVFPGKSLLEVFVNLPLVLPPVVTGYLLLLTFNSEAYLGRLLRQQLGINISYDWKGLIVAAAVMSFPLMVRAIRLGFQSVDASLETAARTLGAGRLTSFFTVSLPLARRGIIAGCVLAFARSLGEFGATVMLVGQQENTRTIPLLIYAMRNRVGGLEEIWRVLIISLILAGTALAASEFLERRGLRRESA